MLIIKKILKKINLRVRVLALKIVFFGGFENDNILSSKSKFGGQVLSYELKFQIS